MKNLIAEKRLAAPLMGVWFLVLCLIAVFTEGTGGGGDSVLHYFFSKYAFKHPELFLDHWAKPVFVLLSAPFAQFGFVGMKIFNCLTAVLTGYFTYRSAKLLHTNNPLLVLVFLFFAPLYFTLIFSGFTEPLFALVLILGVYKALEGKQVNAAIIISFLPFVRSEGLIILGVFAFYFMVKRNFKLLPLLLVGHVFYGIVGSFYYQDLLWVFNKIPYASLSSPYGSGELFAFISKLNYTIGIPLYLMLSLGIIYILLSFLSKVIRSKHPAYQGELILVYGSFTAFFVAHSLFWYLGIFNSMGLKRVLIGVMPLIAIIALNGYNLITLNTLIKKKIPNYIVKGILACYVIIFPFTPNPAAVQWEREFSLVPDQLLINEIAELIRKDFTEYKLYYSHPYVSMAVDQDYFDRSIHGDLRNIGAGTDIPKNSLIIWDNWFSVQEDGVTLESLRSNQNLEEIGTYERERNGRKFKFCVLKR